ncbi:hypothetical protein HKCCE3408_06210 [Rhodobacterales bacterium HKCCE3408]|nr:hypothetical protein [Rhodobacterales bacterium HKCCE3408]
MTTLMLAGIVPPGTPWPDGAPPHERLEAEPGLALALPVPEDADWTGEATTIALAEAQHGLLCRYAAAGDVLPVALGAVFSGRAALAAHLSSEAEQIAGQARLLSGRVEYMLTIDIVAETGSGPAASGGRDHLRRRRAARDRRKDRGAARKRFVDGIARRLSDQALGLRVRPGRGAGRLATIDLLLPRGGLDAISLAVEAILDDAQDLGLCLTLTGPCPAFSFLERPADG